MIVNTITFLSYLDMMGAMQIGDPHKIGDKIFVFYRSHSNNYGQSIAVDNEFYDLITIEQICIDLGIGYDRDLLISM